MGIIAAWTKSDISWKDSMSFVCPNIFNDDLSHIYAVILLIIQTKGLKKEFHIYIRNS